MPDRTIEIRKKRHFVVDNGFSGGLLLSGDLEGHKTGNLPNVDGPPLGTTLSPSGVLAALVSGPSYVTIPMFLGGTVTPTADIVNVAIPNPVNILTMAVDGLLTPSGDLVVSIDPATVRVLRSFTGAIGPAGGAVGTIVPSTVTVLRSVDGTIIPRATIVNVQGGPSNVTVTKSLTASVTPTGAPTNVVVPPPPTFFSKDVAGTITPTSVLATLKGGPSNVTVSIQFVANIVQSATLVTLKGGPSIVTVPKTVSGAVTQVGVVASSVQGPSNQVITQGVTGTIHPIASISSSVSSGPPSSTGALYTSMTQWDMSEFGLSPQWPAITGTTIVGTDTPADWKAIFDAMRARGMRGGPAILNAFSFSDPGPNNTLIFNFTKYKSLVNIIRDVPGIAGYISGGECAIFQVCDEPYHKKWGEPSTFTPALQKQCCQYVKSVLPGIKTWIRAPASRLGYQDATYLPPGGWAGSLNAGASQYTGPNREALQPPSTTDSPTHFFTYARDAMASMGLGCIYGINWVGGGDGSSGIPSTSDDTFMTAQEIRRAIDGAIAVPSTVQVTSNDWCYFWYDAHGSSLPASDQALILQNRSDYVAAFQYAKNAGLARGSTVQPPVYYTDTAPHAPVYPPPAIVVGATRRDALTDHKVYHLLDNARLQSAEYPALSSDNSCIYFVQGGAGMLGDVVWTTSSVQVGTVRSAFSLGFAGVVDGTIWDRNDARFLYYLSGQASLRIFRKNVDAATVVLKDVGADPSFVSMWGAQAGTVLGSGLHSSRSQERFVGIVGAGLGIFVWDRLTNSMWNWKSATVSKVVSRATIDDIGQYVKIHFSDNTWINLALGTAGVYTEIRP